MVVSPSPSHTLGILVVRHDVTVLRELLVTDRALPVLLDDLAIEKFPHLPRRSEFPVSSRVMGILNPLHAEPYQPGLPREFPTTTGKRFVDRTEFVATEPHGIPPDGTG